LGAVGAAEEQEITAMARNVSLKIEKNGFLAIGLGE
jgi:hypothetical protein